MIVAQGFSYMVHTLTSKTTQFIFFQSDCNMVLWLCKWKKEIVDGVQLKKREEELWPH